MCNINAIFKNKDAKQHTSFVGLLQAASGYSYMLNDDGEGAYFNHDDTVVKSLNKINYVAYNKLVHESRVIITHQRISTSGHSPKYLHPFVSDDFVLVHNGVLNGYDAGKHSDTYGLFNRMTRTFAKLSQLDGENREQNIIKTIQECLNHQTGSFSIVLYDKNTGLGYYFKNNGVSIHFFGNEEYLFIATSDMSCLFSETMKEYKVEDYKIYRIQEDADVIAIGDLLPGRQQVYFKQYDDDNSYYGGGRGWHEWDNGDYTTKQYYLDDYNVKRTMNRDDERVIREDIATLMDLEQHDGDTPEKPRPDADSLYSCNRCERRVYWITYNKFYGDFVCALCNASLEGIEARRNEQ